MILRQWRTLFHSRFVLFFEFPAPAISRAIPALAGTPVSHLRPPPDSARTLGSGAPRKSAAFPLSRFSPSAFAPFLPLGRPVPTPIRAPYSFLRSARKSRIANRKSPHLRPSAKSADSPSVFHPCFICALKKIWFPRDQIPSFLVSGRPHTRRQPAIIPSMKLASLHPAAASRGAHAPRVRFFAPSRKTRPHRAPTQSNSSARHSVNASSHSRITHHQLPSLSPIVRPCSSHLCPSFGHFHLSPQPSLSHYMTLNQSNQLPRRSEGGSQSVKASQSKNFQPTVQSPVGKLLTTKTEKHNVPATVCVWWQCGSAAAGRRHSRAPTIVRATVATCGFKLAVPEEICLTPLRFFLQIKMDIFCR